MCELCECEWYTKKKSIQGRHTMKSPSFYSNHHYSPPSSGYIVAHSYKQREHDTAENTKNRTITRFGNVCVCHLICFTMTRIHFKKILKRPHYESKRFGVLIFICFFCKGSLLSTFSKTYS